MFELTVLDTSIRLHDGLYCLNDVHKAGGGEKRHQLPNWLRMDQTEELITEIEQTSDMRFAISIIHGGHNRGTYACKELVYAYAMWISAKFHLAVIRAFDAMLSGNAHQPPPAETITLTKDEYIALQSERIELLMTKVDVLSMKAAGHSRHQPGPRFWSADDDRKLVQLRAEGMGFTHIGRCLGGRSESSCRQRYGRIQAVGGGAS